MRWFLKVFTSLLLLSILGCDSDADNRQIDVAEDVVLNLLPSLYPIGYGLNFSFQSDSLYNCQNVEFSYTLQSTADKVKIHLLGVDIPAFCIDGVAPAFEKVKVPGEDGIYSISIDIGEYIHNTGTLVIKNDVYQLNMNSRYGMAIPHVEMFRIPEGTIWGYASTSNPNMQNQISNSVKNELLTIAGDVDLKEGYYGYFSIAKPVGIYTQFPSYQSAQACFVFHFTKDHAILENVIENIRAQLPPGTSFKVFTWEGTEL